MIGVSTFCLHQQPLPDALEQLQGITGLVEIMDDGPHRITDPALLENFSYRYTIHSPSRGVNIASLLEPIRRASVEVTRECFSVAADLGAGVVIHPGYFAWEQEHEQANRQFQRSLVELSIEATDLSVIFSIENMGDWDYFLLKRPDELELIGDCGFALDVGHANLNGCLPEFLETTVKHIHLHDNDGTADSHNAVGKGTIDFKAVMKTARRERATQIVEVGTLEGVISSINTLKSL